MTEQFPAFVRQLAESDLRLVDVAVAILWLNDHYSPNYEATTSDLADEMMALRLCGHIKRSRLKADLQQHPATIAGGGRDTFRIALKAKGGLDQQYLQYLTPTPVAEKAQGVSYPVPSQRRIFIGHGRSPIWRDLKDFLVERLNLSWDEFNREPVAGHTTVERLRNMLDQASFAFLVMTAEDEHADGTHHARENVVHEVGLFQGRLGFNKAIVLLEEGCSEFSNIHGLTQIRFPKGNLRAQSEEIRRVLEREGVSS